MGMNWFNWNPIKCMHFIGFNWSYATAVIQVFTEKEKYLEWTNSTKQNLNYDPFFYSRIRIGDLGQGSYTLTAKGKKPIEFEETQKLEYVHKGYSIFIQTDKAIYRPGKLTSTCLITRLKIQP